MSAIGWARVVAGMLTVVIVVASLGIMRLYYQVHKMEKRAENPHLLPIHVWTISLSYVLISATLPVPMGWLRMGLGIPGLILGCYSLAVVWRGTYLRYWAGPEVKE